MKDIIEKIYNFTLEEIMGDRFGKYSKYIIQDRAIPDVRDGLKPVQRRILFSMFSEGITYDKPYKKSARVVGDVMGKYHPHGDSSIYEALIRMSQPWKMGTCLIDVHGNNGSIDGDSPAAMRYTEARLAKISNELLKDLNKNTVVMTWNYDDNLQEPTVLPCKFPNLLVNGATGISAGYATNIPPHNLGEIIDATIKRIDSPNCRLDTIMDIVKGPDFPTGGIIEGIDGIRAAYETGRGKIIVKSKYEIVKNKIIVTEIPYDVNKSVLVKKIDEIRIDKKIDGIVDVIDESDREGLQITIEVRKEADPNLILNYLLKNTDLQISYNFNMVSIVNRRPMLLGILPILDAYIAHQKEVTTKSKQYDLDFAEARMHIVEGLIKALSILDEVIKTIRASKNKADAKENLVIKYKFTEAQAEAIVMLQLYKLTNTDVTLLEEEMTRLKKLIEMLKGILSDEHKLNEVIKESLRKIKKEYAIQRLTEVKDEVTEIKIDTTLMINKDDFIVCVTKDGYLKRVSERSFNSSNNEDNQLKEKDYVIGLYKINNLDTILLFTNLGNYIYLPVYEIPEAKWKELGKHISNIIPLSSDEHLISSVPVYDFDGDLEIISFSKLGMVKRTKLNEFKVSRYSKPIKMMNLKDKDEVISAICNRGNDVYVVTKNGYGLWYTKEEISLVGVKASGVKSINLKNDEVIAGIIFDDTCEYLSLITDKGTGKRIKLSTLEKGTRANRGISLMKEIKSNPSKFISAYIENSKHEIGLVGDDITIIKLNEMPIMDRYSNGSYISKNKLLSTFKTETLITKENMFINDKQETIEKEVEIVNSDESLKKIDEKILTIDDLIKDIEGKKEF